MSRTSPSFCDQSNLSLSARDGDGLVGMALVTDRQTDRYFIDRKEKSLQTYLS